MDCIELKISEQNPFGMNESMMFVAQWIAPDWINDLWPAGPYQSGLWPACRARRHGLAGRGWWVACAVCRMCLPPAYLYGVFRSGIREHMFM